MPLRGHCPCRGSQSSTNYSVESDVVSVGGGESDSDNYFHERTTGPSAIGESASDNYVSHAGFWYTVPPVDVGDSDGDGVPDNADKCIDVRNPGQEDANAGEDDNTSIEGDQHYGNACDMDIDNNGFKGLEDFNSRGRASVSHHLPAALDCDAGGFIGLEDFNCLRTYFGKAPGPGTGD